MATWLILERPRMSRTFTDMPTIQFNSPAQAFLNWNLCTFNTIDLFCGDLRMCTYYCVLIPLVASLYLQGQWFEWCHHYTTYERGGGAGAKVSKQKLYEVYANMCNCVVLQVLLLLFFDYNHNWSSTGIGNCSPVNVFCGSCLLGMWIGRSITI